MTLTSTAKQTLLCLAKQGPRLQVERLKLASSTHSHLFIELRHSCNILLSGSTSRYSNWLSAIALLFIAVMVRLNDQFQTFICRAALGFCTERPPAGPSFSSRQGEALSEIIDQQQT